MADLGFGRILVASKALPLSITRTKEVIKIAASTVPVFKAGKEFKEKVNK